MLKQNKKQKEQQGLALILVLGFLLRLFLATATEGYPYDTSCFFAWGARMFDVGMVDFYATDYFCDYPPAYLYVLWLVNAFMSLFRTNYLEPLAQALLVLVPACADVALGGVLYFVARRAGHEKIALRMAAFVSFCPMFWYDTAVWKQIDGVFALLLVGAFYLIAQQKWLLGAALYGLALAVKPQALMAGPVLAICFLLPFFFAKDRKELFVALKNAALGVVAALAPLYLCALPFFGFGNTTLSLYQLYATTASSYPYASVNAFNFIAACGGNWVSQTEKMTISWFGNEISMFFTWEAFGNVAILLITAYLVYLGVSAYRKGAEHFSPVLLAAVYMIAVFTFAHRMHERYLLIGVALLLCAVAQRNNMRLLSLAAGFSFMTLLNMAVVYTVVETDDAFLSSATSILVMRTVGVVETLLCLLLLYEAWRICVGKPRKDVAFGYQEVASVVASETDCDTPAPQPKWCKAEIIFVCLLTAFVAVLSFTYLGDFTAAQNPLDVRTSSYTETVYVEGDAASLWVYAGVTESDATLSVLDENGMLLLESELAIGGLFQWNSYSILPSGAYTITITNVEMMELGFKDADGNLCSLTFETGTPSALFDEQDLIPEESSQLNGFYFDEIYHARTAYESINGMSIYEISHPPMGKNFIALGILLFGMTGFGWRFAGVLFGVLMVPVIYWLTRRLTRNVKVAGFVALLLSFDFMRYSQSRIATIDTISAFFILLSATLMVWYCQSVLEKGVRKSVLPMALAGLAFGFGAASKWTGIYAGAGLAILFFGVLVVRYVQLTKQATKRKAFDKVAYRKEVTTAIVGGFAFFVFVPLFIYIASYLPYRLADASFGFTSWYENQTYMYWYHSSLDATHPFSSSWYSWFLDLRPVWYYMGSGLEEGTYASIAGFYNPILCWVGIVAWLRLCLKALKGKGNFVSSALIVLFLSQFLPWLLVTRCTFLYHYFPSFLFTVVAIGLWAKDILEENEARAYTLASGLLTLVIFFFVWFYPVLSGLPVGELWAQTLKLLPSYGFYIIS